MLTEQHRAALRAHEHYNKYDDLARRIGVDALRQLVPFQRREIVAALQSLDSALNSLPLEIWDTQHPLVKEHAHRARIELWSIESSTCLLKHVAVYYVAGKGDAQAPLKHYSK